MARYAYVRVSTQAQSYDRQILKLNEYFDRMGTDKDSITIVSEKITSHTRFTQREIYPILEKASEGDIIYVCQLDRLGRTMVDILELVDYATKKGIILLTIDNGYQLENRTAMGKMYLGILSAMAEAERELRAERCQAGLDAAKEELARKGKRIARCSGRVQTHFGNQKGCDMSKAVEASAIKRVNDAILWLEKSKAVSRARAKRAEGWKIDDIVKDLCELYDDFEEDGPNPYGTATGCKPTKGTVSKWCREMNPIAI